MKNKKLISLIATLIFCLLKISDSLAQARTHSFANEEPVLTAQRFLQAIYPDLNGKNLFISLDIYFKYDQIGQPLSWFRVSVGEGPKNVLLRHSGGCLAIPMPGSATNPPALTEPGPPVDCRKGDIYPTQYFSSIFSFDKRGHLVSYGMEGAATREVKERNIFAELVRAHPTMTEAEVLAALKAAGAKYGPQDKEQFIKDLPLSKLEPFLGKIRLVSVETRKLPENRLNVDTWPDWRVTIDATPLDGRQIRYEMLFDQFNGDLVSLAPFTMER